MMKRPDVRRWFSSRLSRQYILWTFLFGACLTTLLTLLDVAVFYMTRRADIEAELHKIIDVYAHPLGRAVWEFNIPLIEDTLSGIASTTNIGYIELRTPDFLQTTGTPLDDSALSASSELIFDGPGPAQAMGTLSLYSDTRDLRSASLLFALERLASNMFRSVLLLVFSFFVFDRLVNRHLTEIVRRTARGALLNADSAPYRLVRNRFAHRAPDELDDVVSVLNGMKVRIAQQIGELHVLSEQRLQSLRAIERILHTLDVYVTFYQPDGTTIYASPPPAHVSRDIAGLMTEPADCADTAARLARARGFRVSSIRATRAQPHVQTTDAVLYQLELTRDPGLVWHVYGIRLDPQAIAMVFADRSALRDVERSLQTAQKLEALGKLSGSVAHEFNNYLAIIQANAEELEAGDPGHDLRQIGVITGTVSKAAQVIAQLLGPLRTETADHDVPLPVTPAFAEISANVQPFLRDDIAFSVHARDGLALAVTASDLESALLNLIKNSVEAIRGPGRIDLIARTPEPGEVTARQLPPGRDFVVIEVSDSGPGIDRASLDKVFEPFFSTKKHSGTGLGLWSVYTFCRNVGGGVVYEPPLPEAGVPGRFLLYLPRLRTETPADNVVRVGTSGAFQALRMLICEDEPHLLQAYSAYFTRLGARIVAVRDARDARAALAGDSFDVLICDYTLPDGNGLEICAAFKAATPAGRCLILSGNPDEACNTAAFVDIVLSKPLRLSTLSGHVADLMTRPGAGPADKAGPERAHGHER